MRVARAAVEALGNAGEFGLTFAELAEKCGVTKESGRHVIAAMRAGGWPVETWRAGPQLVRVRLAETRTTVEGEVVLVVGKAA